MNNKIVICRLNNDIVGGVIGIGILFILMTIGTFFTGPQGVSPVTHALAGMGLYVALVTPLVWIYFRCRIIADEKGLEIRGIFYKRFVLWSEIRDFYCEPHPRDSAVKQNAYFIEYGKHKLNLWPGFKNITELLEVISVRATEAPSEKFEVKESRDMGETPQVFEYTNPKLWPITLLTTVLVVLLAISPFLDALGKQGISGAIDVYDGYTWQMKLGLLAWPAFGLALGLVSMLLTKKEQAYAGQQIIVSKNGVEWRDGTKNTEIQWHEIENYYLESMSGYPNWTLCMVEASDKHITFLRRIPKVHILRLLIEQNAINAKADSWQFAKGRNIEILGPPMDLANEEKIVFHYKTRTSRAMLCLGSFIWLFVSTVILAGIGNIDAVLTTISVLLIMGLTILYGWLAYSRTSIEVDNNGIHHNTRFGKKFIAWNEITRLNSVNLYSIKSGTMTIRIPPFLAEPERFQEAVTQRTGKVWERPAYEKQYQLEE